MDIPNITNITGIIINRNIHYNIHLMLFLFLMPLIVKSSQIFLKHNVYGFIFQLIYFYSISIQNSVSSIVMQILKDLLFDLTILIKHLTSPVIVTPSNVSVESPQRSKISFCLLWACTEELLSTPKITTCLPHSPFDNKNYERASNPIP